MFQNKELIIFDMDGTLAVSKTPLESDMAWLVVKLLEKMKVAVISGGKFVQFETQLLSKLPAEFSHLANLFLLPTTGTHLYVWDGKWNEQFAENLSEDDKKKIIESLNFALEQTGFDFSEKAYGERIEDRESQISFSALGQQAPAALKVLWDPHQKRRERIVNVLKEKIPEFDIHLGGGTTIDITLKGVNKAYGIRRLLEFLHVPTEKVIFVGDALYPGGNDFPAKSTGVECIQVSSPEETKKVIAQFLE